MNVYDFDNTIYDGESLVDFFLLCISKKKILILYLPLIFYTLILYKLCLLSNDKLYRLASKLSKQVIKNKDNVESFVKEFWVKNKSKLKPYFLKKLKSHDIIITGSPRMLIEGIKDELNTDNIICSEFNVETGLFEFICLKENKVKAFKEKYPNTIIEEFYTDSLNDLPLIQISKKAFLVKKNNKLELINKTNI